MVELRKRPAPPPAPEPARKRSAPKKNDTKAAAAKSAKPDPAPAPAASEKKKAAAAAPPAASPRTVPAKAGDTIDLAGYGGEIEDNDGNKVTLAKLVESSKAGVVLFTYPKASTPGCTNQACMFRDSYKPLTATGLDIYGLSTDSPKANTTFKTKQNLPYPLLCDPAATLIQAIGLKKAPKGTQRGVFVVTKEGKVLAAEPGGPAATVEVVKKIVGETSGQAEGGAIEKVGERADAAEGDEAEDKKVADTAAEVADVAKEIDGTPKPSA